MQQHHQLGSPLGSPTTKASTPLLEVTPIPPVYFDRELEEAGRGSGASDPSGAASSSDMSGKSPASASSDPTARYRKALEASSRGHLLSTTSSSSSPTASSLGLPPSPRRGGSNLNAQPLVSAPLDVDIQPDIIIQHRDGGIVQELPPPYADRSGQRAPSPIPPPDTRPPPPAEPPQGDSS